MSLVPIHTLSERIKTMWSKASCLGNQYSNVETKLALSWSTQFLEFTFFSGPSLCWRLHHRLSVNWASQLYFIKMWSGHEIWQTFYPRTITVPFPWFLANKLDGCCRGIAVIYYHSQPQFGDMKKVLFIVTELIFSYVITWSFSHKYFEERLRDVYMKLWRKSLPS